MAVEIQEPNDIPPNSITDETADRYEVLVYEQSQDAAGIKRLAIAGWKQYLGFNTHKVNNVASYLGMPSDYHWDSNQDIPYEGTTVSKQIENLSTKLGISTEGQTFDPLYPRFQTVENNVNGTGSPATGGLMQRMTSAEADIQSLSEEIGGGGGGGSSSLTSRINALETTVGDSSSGLVKDVNDIQDDIGDPATTGTIKGDISGLRTDVDTLKDTVDGDGTPGNGLTNRVGALEDTVDGDGTPTSGLTNRVGTLENQVADLVANVYTYKGNIESVDDPDTTTEITVDGNTVSLSNLKNGWVYNIAPESGTTITINGKSYDEGENIVWLLPEGGTGYFDELGANIDVSAITELQTKVSTLETTVNGNGTPANPGLTGKVNTLNDTIYGDGTSANPGLENKVNNMLRVQTVNSSWSSGTANLGAGIYQFSCRLAPTTGAPAISTFILCLDSTGASQTASPVDVSANFADFWELDSSNLLKPKTVAGVTSRMVSILKIGEQ